MKSITARLLMVHDGKPGSFRDNRGMASFALFIFAVVSVLVLVANYQMNSAVSSTSDAYDTFNSQLVEKNGIAQVVKESILAIGETAIVTSGNSLQTEIQNRLSSMSFPSGATVAIDPGTPVPNVPANPFFPNSPLASYQPDYFTSASIRATAGMGNLFSSLCELGPASDLGRLVFAFDRTSGASPDDNQTYIVNADLFSVPLTNVDVIAYGMPITVSIPQAAPAVPAGFFGSDVSRLVVTSNNPANDPTAYSDLFASSGVEKLPYQYRNAVSFSWNAYEYLWSAAYQNALISAASLNGTIYNFAFPPAPPPLPAPQNQPFPGATTNGTAVTIDCSAVVSPTGSPVVVAVVDPNGGGNLTITGSAAAGTPFILLVRNTPGQPPTQVTFTGDPVTGANNRPAIFYFENSVVQFSGNPQIQGGLFLDPYTTASGAVTWFGHFSFYGPASPLSTLGITMADNPTVKSALASIAPRVLLVSTSATR
jgi:hypothetical protein